MASLVYFGNIPHQRLFLQSLGITQKEACGKTDISQVEVGAFYWTALAPEIVNSGQEELGSVSV